MRQDQMTKLRALYVSLGGLASDLKLSTTPLDLYIAVNFDRIQKALVTTQNTSHYNPSQHTTIYHKPVYIYIYIYCRYQEQQRANERTRIRRRD